MNAMPADRSHIGEAIRRAQASKEMGRARSRKPENARRAPFPKIIPKGMKRQPGGEAARVPAYIRAAEGDLRPDDRAYIRRKLGRRLGKFSDTIERVSVRTADVNGPRGGIDRVCRIKVVLRALPSVVLEHRNSSLAVAVDRTLAGVETAVRRAIRRRRAQLHRPAARRKGE